MFNRSGAEIGSEDNDTVNMEMGRVVKGKIRSWSRRIRSAYEERLLLFT